MRFERFLEVALVLKTGHQPLLGSEFNNVLSYFFLREFQHNKEATSVVMAVLFERANVPSNRQL